MYYPPQHQMPSPDGVLHDALHHTDDPDQPNADLYGPPPGDRKNRAPGRQSWLAWLVLFVIVLGVAALVVFTFH